MKKYLNRLFIDGLSGMSYGLFSTLIIGTIICQIGKLVGGNVVGTYLNAMGSVAKTLTGAGIGVGVACKLKSSPLVAVAAGVTGMIGAFPNLANEAFKIGAPGEPLGAFIAAYIAIEIGALVSGKTKVDIIVTPVCCILAGAVAGYFVGPYISTAMKWLGELVNINVENSPILGGIAISALMGVILTLPISSAAIGISMGITGSDAAIEASNIVLMTDNLNKITEAIKISKKTKRIVTFNIVFALLVKFLCLLLGVLGISKIWFAVVADVGVTLLLVLNSLRLIIVKKVH